MRVIPEYNRKLLTRYDRQLPRYTSYPTALLFQENFSPEVWRSALHNSVHSQQPYSLYVHIPYCSSPCFYCACNRIITRDCERSKVYLEALFKEIELTANLLPVEARKASQLHLGGGSPTFLSGEELAALWKHIGDHFELQADGEYSIEIDPRASSVELIHHLADIGFNRMSFGVQDLDPDVQDAINRRQSPQETFAQIQAARDAGIESINADLIYGLPRQTLQTFANTIEQVIAARPDRVAVYHYAHMPQLFKAQTQIDKYELPTLSEKLRLLEHAINAFQEAGYEYIGLDHFALPDDELAIARREDTLHRNFQGYSTQAECDMLGFGLTSIGKIGDTFYQNIKDEKAYLQSLQEGTLPLAKGYTSNRDDAIRGRAIMDLMCHGYLHLNEFKQQVGQSFFDYFADAIDELRSMEADKLLTLTDDELTITPTGHLLLRNICYTLDAYRRK